MQVTLVQWRYKVLACRADALYEKGCVYNSEKDLPSCSNMEVFVVSVDI